ncbi:hypothetical protein NQ314_015726 [Rhamnusium bicolor]|uniref:Uncharacterized protein n=1 Tax=Rhamnusium bicolor TaxID=1586634 RepID=A0AAV8WY53_9CUCU|nr:hypothetical protein NQ314_015726 [Rhamnusium bicolor]
MCSIFLWRTSTRCMHYYMSKCWVLLQRGIFKK